MVADLGADNNRSLSLGRRGELGRKRNESAVVGIAISRKKDSLLSVNGVASFQNRYSANF